MNRMVLKILTHIENTPKKKIKRRKKAKRRNSSFPPKWKSWREFLKLYTWIDTENFVHPLLFISYEAITIHSLLLFSTSKSLYIYKPINLVFIQFQWTMNIHTCNYIRITTIEQPFQKGIRKFTWNVLDIMSSWSATWFRHLQQLYKRGPNSAIEI